VPCDAVKTIYFFAGTCICYDYRRMVPEYCNELFAYCLVNGFIVEETGGFIQLAEFI
jgi:hypothetical protein